MKTEAAIYNGAIEDAKKAFNVWRGSYNESVLDSLKKPEHSAPDKKQIHILKVRSELIDSTNELIDDGLTQDEIEWIKDKFSYAKPIPEAAPEPTEDLDFFELTEFYANCDVGGASVQQDAERLISEVRRWRELAKKQEPHVHRLTEHSFTNMFSCSCGAIQTITEKQ